jgi:hypothetical protein
MKRVSENIILSLNMGVDIGQRAYKYGGMVTGVQGVQGVTAPVSTPRLGVPPSRAELNDFVMIIHSESRITYLKTVHIGGTVNLGGLMLNPVNPPGSEAAWNSADSYLSRTISSGSDD